MKKLYLIEVTKGYNEYCLPFVTEIEIIKETPKMIYARALYKRQHYKDDFEKIKIKGNHRGLEPYVMTLDYSKIDEYKEMIKEHLIIELNSRVEGNKINIKRYEDIRNIFE
jgi:hypothetical protein